jgi:hypothetical protein
MHFLKHLYLFQLFAQAYMERVHAPLLMNPLVQAIVVALFVTGGWVWGCKA